MKGTDHFKELIKNYLDNRAKEDELFRAKYETTTRTIDDVVNYIFHAVQQSGCCGFSDMEVYAMAVHAIDESNLEIGKPMDCNVVVNHHIELTEEEKAEQRAIALKRYQEEEMREIAATQQPTQGSQTATPTHSRTLTLSRHGTMKARTKIEKQVAASNEKLTAISPKVLTLGSAESGRTCLLPDFRIQVYVW